MRTLRAAFALTLCAIAAWSAAQTTPPPAEGTPQTWSSWSDAYAAGLRAARAGDWAAARYAFKQAIVFRTEDASAPTNLPGPPTEPRRWRNGSPYSPNFLAAYAAYRQATGIADPTESTALMNTAAQELETLLAKDQHARETYFFLTTIYARTGDADKRKALEERAAARGNKFTWKIDREPITPEDLGAFQATAGTTAGGSGSPGGIPTVRAGDELNNLATTPAGGVAAVPTKFAFIVGNAQSRLTDGLIPFAEDDARRVREALIASAGYPEANIDMVLNSTSQQLIESARALAERVPEGGTVFIYFSGAGVNVDGRDFLAGVESELATDTTSMVSKIDIYRLFMAKGARIFAFFQVNRPVENGRYFGSEVPLVGSIAQTQATLPGESVTSYVRDGKPVGIFTDALVRVLGEIRSNRVPIMEFGWQIFYRMRRSDTGTTGGSSRQTPTLPYVTNMAADARF